MQRADAGQRDQHPGAQHDAQPLDVGLALAAHEPAGLAQHRLRALGQFAGVVDRRSPAAPSSAVPVKVGEVAVAERGQAGIGGVADGAVRVAVAEQRLRAMTAVGRVASHSRSSALTVQLLESFRVMVDAGSPSSLGAAK